MKIPKKQHPFKTPNGYFEAFSEDLKTRLAEEHLSIPKKPGFKVPTDYFDTLATSIASKNETAKTKVIPLIPNKFYYMAVASVAAVALVFFGLRWSNTAQTSWDTVANSDIENYFDANGLALTSYEIAEVIPVDNLDMTDFLETELQEEYILDYLSEETTDFETLNLEENE